MFCKRLDCRGVTFPWRSVGPCSEIRIYSMGSMCSSGVDDLFGGDGMWVGDGKPYPSWMDRLDHTKTLDIGCCAGMRKYLVIFSPGISTNRFCCVVVAKSAEETQ